MYSTLRIIDDDEGLTTVIKRGAEAHAFIVGIVETADMGGEGEEESLGGGIIRPRLLRIHPLYLEVNP